MTFVAIGALRVNNKNLILMHEHHYGADQTTRTYRLASTFVVGFLESILDYLYIGETRASMVPFYKKYNFRMNITTTCSSVKPLYSSKVQ